MYTTCANIKIRSKRAKYIVQYSRARTAVRSLGRCVPPPTAPNSACWWVVPDLSLLKEAWLGTCRRWCSCPVALCIRSWRARTPAPCWGCVADSLLGMHGHLQSRDTPPPLPPAWSLRSMVLEELALRWIYGAGVLSCPRWRGSLKGCRIHSGAGESEQRCVGYQGDKLVGGFGKSGDRSFPMRHIKQSWSPDRHTELTIWAHYPPRQAFTWPQRAAACPNVTRESNWWRWVECAHHPVPCMHRSRGTTAMPSVKTCRWRGRFATPAFPLSRWRYQTCRQWRIHMYARGCTGDNGWKLISC
jgi:hypothetical protein